ncbi:ABC transporter substrate-binding protein [Dietzia sp.]|uniref:ABC transporter substrate-binding protein n=1 Tax=Dietzia sp. TaxID=1871616 RepID=UPI002FD99C25
MTDNSITSRKRRTPRAALAAIAAVLVPALAISACDSSDGGSDGSGAGDAQSVSLLLDWAPNPDHASLYTAKASGAYEEQGLDVDFATPANTADAAREVSLGRSDLAISYEPDVIIDRAQGLDVVSVAALIPTAITSLIAKKDSGISSAKDLAGKTVGTSGLASQDPTLDFIARKAGIDPSSVEKPNIQQNLEQALLTDQVDAIFGAYANIEGVELSQRAAITTLTATEMGVPDYAELVVIANPKRLADDPAYAERVRKFLSGTAEGQRTAKTDAQQAVDALAPETEGSYDEETLKTMVDATLALLPDGGFVPQKPEDWAEYATWMHDNGLLDVDVDGAHATTNDYLPT